MYKQAGQLLYSASDLVNFMECEHLTKLDLIHLESPLPVTEDSDNAKLIQDKGFEHEARFVEYLKKTHASFIDINQASSGGLDDKVAATIKAMKDGVEIIYQASLRSGNLAGHADFLRKVDRPSKLGNYSYEVLDTKLAKKTKAKFIIQLGFYSALVAEIQGVEPQYMYVILGDQTEEAFRCADYAKYLAELTKRFLDRVTATSIDTYPDPCDKCKQCRWQDLCEELRIKDDHLSQVANITKLQIQKLYSVGVTTLADLATLEPTKVVPEMAQETLGKIRAQAAIQYKRRLSGKNELEFLPIDPDPQTFKGFRRLPKPDEGDLYFDMEGDPLEEDGLEYLFGLYFKENGAMVFKPFWAHSRSEEKRAFEDFMDFVTAWLAQHPKAHIYHYAHYEETALKKLMSLHGTREAAVDNFLREQKLVDLYKVVRESIRVSEPRYSIKNIEHFYLEQRTGDVTNAGASIVFYERWKETGEQKFLDDIAAYNEDDVRSTHELHLWLLSLRPDDLPWTQSDREAVEPTKSDLPLNDAEQELAYFYQELIAPLPTDREDWNKDHHMAELVYQLLDFHRRSDKPAWWAMFARKEMTTAELIEDMESLGGLTPDPNHPPYPEKRSVVYTYQFPEQESKLKTGDSATVTLASMAVSNLIVDDASKTVSFSLAANKELPNAVFGLGPAVPLRATAIQEALRRFARSVLRNDHKYRAVESLLKHEHPRIHGHIDGQTIIPANGDTVSASINAISGLDHSCIFVQGPPGAGKTYTGSHVIVALMRAGYKVGISSNSHKAINNLLSGVEKVAAAQDYKFAGVKKCTSAENKFDSSSGCIKNKYKTEEVIGALYSGGQLAAGTAWLFASEGLDQELDYLFVDEAGQVALANLVAMGTSTKNIVLLGDQMQLGQPIQGVHPGRSGESSLEYLLNGKSTIPAEMGIFLDKTWRMHPDLCQFISDAVYDGRLLPEAKNINQCLVLNTNAHPALKPTGIRYLPVEHDGCSQKSQEEADRINELIVSLLKQQYRDKDGITHPLTLNDILVVAPFNMQVNLLSKTLPAGARVGTVDKFQGQEAAVVIVSMATSSGDYLPRNIEFLYSKNRLNVAISRAKCLAVFVASPKLMTISCSKPEQMALVNTLCWLSDYQFNDD